jgi:hypothetical protein
MARTVVAIYDDFLSANSAVRDLVDSGFPRDNISLVANNTRGEYGYTGTTTATSATTGTESVADETGAGAGVGAGIGAAIGGIGGLLIGLGALVIPGIGPIIAAGPLAVALSTLTGAGVGAVAGGVTGGLLGALVGLGIPEEEAGFYAEGVRRGGVLVTVQTEDQNTDQVLDLLNRHNPIDINTRVEEWRRQGWTGYDPNVQTYNETTGMTHEVPNTGMSQDTHIARHAFDREYEVYRNHYNNDLVDSGYPYDYYVPAYQYGYNMANHPDYHGRSWDMVEYEFQRDWERDHPGTWERFKSAIRNAWDDVTGR